jgi:hypothetical protein
VIITTVPPVVGPVTGAILEMVTGGEAAEVGIAVTIAREQVMASDTTIIRRRDISRARGRRAVPMEKPFPINVGGTIHGQHPTDVANAVYITYVHAVNLNA